MNRILVRTKPELDIVEYHGCSIILDNADHSVRIEKGSETVAHYDRDEYYVITQEIG